MNKKAAGGVLSIIIPMLLFTLVVVLAFVILAVFKTQKVSLDGEKGGVVQSAMYPYYALPMILNSMWEYNGKDVSFYELVYYDKHKEYERKISEYLWKLDPKISILIFNAPCGLISAEDLTKGNMAYSFNSRSLISNNRYRDKRVSKFIQSVTFEDTCVAMYYYVNTLSIEKYYEKSDPFPLVSRKL